MKIRLRNKISRVVLKGVKDRPGIAAKIFTTLGEHGFGIENISETGLSRGRADISFTILDRDLEEVVSLLKTRIASYGAEEVKVDRDVVEIMIRGKDANRPGMAGKVFAILGGLGINIEMITTALNTLTMVIQRNRADEALKALNRRFGDSS
ncbi:MAG TPA: ACT domain-containing protein [bacterium (Candidatus Stahlbacteria)]|nr:ACT domain-containing protein [Candidatus Stahlbacteria bacterium]